MRSSHRQDRLAPRREVLRGLGLFHDDAFIDCLVRQFRVERQSFRKLDRSEFELVRFQRSKRTSAARIHSCHVQRVHGATDQRDLFFGRRCQHVKLPATVVAYLAALLRVSRRVSTRRDVTCGNRLPRFLPTAR